MIVSAGGRRVAIRPDEASATFTGVEVLLRECAGSTVIGKPVRMVVELSRGFSGFTMRALLGATFEPDRLAPATTLEVPFGGPLALGVSATCHSELGNLLVPGLPSDFADAVARGMTDAASSRPLSLGRLRVDRAGYDEVGSSTEAFYLGGRLLHEVLTAVLNGDDLEEAARASIDGW